ncbi:DUF6879 family protein [Actinomadura viridis]|uniref:DUF6879 family protein n=1 Tax=Actinomadura viridis TaxID=58110 RepID=UPI003698C943
MNLITEKQFFQHFADFQQSATRIETLDNYLVNDEREHFALYQTGAPLPPERNQAWAGLVRDAVANGKYMGRVHILGPALTPYLQFEIDWYYAVNSAAGEDIRFIFAEDVPAEVIFSDTWLFDDTIVIHLGYDEDGRLLRIIRSDDPTSLRHARTAWTEFYRRSFPLAELLSKIRQNELKIPGQ